MVIYIEEWKVGKARHGYYIFNKYLGVYLHADGTLNEQCGIKNFWKTYKKAFSFLKNWYNSKNEFIKEEEMMI